MARSLKQNIINFPNLLTLSRILITPFLVYTILLQKPGLALTLLVIAGLTDMLDGLWAKCFQQQTDIGALLDPVADKLMLVSCIVVLFNIDQVPPFLFLAVIFRDAIIIIGAVSYEIVTHSLKMQPSLLSKATTFMQIVYIAVVLLNMVAPVMPVFMVAILWLTFGLTCMSGLHYMVSWTLKAMLSEDV